jgi:hypothetical protein
MKKTQPKRARKSYEDKIAELQQKIEAIKRREEEKKQKKSPVLRFVRGALTSIDKALASCDDNVMKKELGEARLILSALLAMGGASAASLTPVARASGRRSSVEVENLGEMLLSHVKKHPGQRGEQIASDLGTDTKTMRLPMKKLIEDGKITTKGQRRGMCYFPA